jgi:leader peptidase (prepilin peptidase)/N-methyltransferase
VIYRLPAGLSLLHPPSRCPTCETPIRASDNVPIFGWLWLGGRCRQCKAKISARYPAVELLVALVFVVLALIEPLDWGRNLPAAEDKLTQNELWGIYAYHLFLLCSLICAAFTEFDGHGMTKRLMLPGLVVAIIAPMVWPHLRPMAALVASPMWLTVPVEGLIGVVAGTVLGFVSAWASRMWRPKSRFLATSPSSFAIGLAWVGGFLGWQAALGLAVAAVAAHLLATMVGRIVLGDSRVGLVGCLTPCTFGWILAWRTIAETLGRL